MSMTQTPPFLHNQKTKFIGMFVCGLFAFICFGAWAGERYGRINVDWSFLLPLAGFVAVAIPLGITVNDWITKKQTAFEKTIDELQAQVRILELNSETSRIERDHLKGRIIRLEVTYSAFLDK